MIVALALVVMAILVNLTPLKEQTWLRVLFGISALNFTLRATVPLVLGALSGILCERSGIINIGIEGMMLAGAFAGFVAKTSTNHWPLAASLIFSVVVAMGVGGLMGAVHALFLNPVSHGPDHLRHRHHYPGPGNLLLPLQPRRHR